MNNIQYTIRNIPVDVDTALRQRAKKSQKSFNATVVDALQTSVLKTKQASKNNLDWFYGSGGIGESELKAFEDQRQIDKSA